MAHIWLILALIVVTGHVFEADADQKCNNLDENKTKKVEALVKLISAKRASLRHESPSVRCDTLVRDIVGEALALDLIGHDERGMDELVQFKTVIELVKARAECFDRTPTKLGSGLRTLVSFLDGCTNLAKSGDDKSVPQSNLAPSSKQSGMEDVQSLKQANQELLKQLSEKNQELSAKEALVQQVRSELAAIKSKPTAKPDLSPAEMSELITLREKVGLLEIQIDQMKLAKEQKEKQQDMLERVEPLPSEEPATKQCQDELAQAESQLRQAVEELQELQQLKPTIQKLVEELEQKNQRLSAQEPLVQQVSDENDSETQSSDDHSLKQIQERIAELESELHNVSAEKESWKKIATEYSKEAN